MVYYWHRITHTRGFEFVKGALDSDKNPHGWSLLQVTFPPGAGETP